jgi:hypothetical protein
MKSNNISDEEKIKGQQEIDAWFDSVPGEAAELLEELAAKISRMESFTVLSNIAFYNHMHDRDKYTDYRGDKMFVVSETVSLIALKRPYVSESASDMGECLQLIKEIQETAHKYFTLKTIVQFKNNHVKDDLSLEGIAFKTMRDETTIRNPGMPYHHHLFSSELYAPLSSEIKARFGFSIPQSIKISKSIVQLINKQFFEAKNQIPQKAIDLFTDVFHYRATGEMPENSLLSKAELEQLKILSRKQIKEACHSYCMNRLYLRLGSLYCFSADDLALAAELDVPTVQNFLSEFSCQFGCVSEEDDVVGPTNIFKAKPLIEHNGRYLIPSMPLLVWCVEPAIETYIKSVPKLQKRFSDIKHDFLLTRGINLLKKIMHNKVATYTNLYYYLNENKENRYETDGIFLYERTLFIIEAKGHRISQAAKEGKILRTEKHLNEIVKESYEQGLRTLEYIKGASQANFHDDKKNEVAFRKQDFDEAVLISLILEPIGAITPLIRSTNELGFFNNGIFPWIISLYDLEVIADHLEMPILLPHYIKRRQEFLSKKILYVFEELDLLAYYLSNRLHVEHTHQEAEAENVNIVYYDNETDNINNYYIQKYEHKHPNPPKVTLTMPDIFIRLLASIEKASFSHRQDLMMGLLDMSAPTLSQFGEFISKIKGMFFQDGKKHDCAIMTTIWGKKVGFSFMTAQTKSELNENLFMYGQYKIQQMNADLWLGVGDNQRDKDNFSIVTGLVTKRS